jgi:vacuolar-type H+-ATPase catalytic subunit A/Vma1
MKAATVTQLKRELQNRPPEELLQLCLRLAKFKKENKELLTYLLFEAQDEEGYIKVVQQEIDEQFEQINRKSFYFIKKSLRKILRMVKKYIRYSSKKETEVELLIYFCHKLQQMQPSFKRSSVLKNLYQRQIDLIKKAIEKLHEDLQADYEYELKDLHLVE